MWSKVTDYVRRHKLLDASQVYVVALSGGADSTALLLWLVEMGYRVHAAHCNFHLRGDESDRDEEFCEQLCKQQNVPFHRAHFDTRAYCEVHHVSIEMGARELRYRWFEQLRQDLGAAAICVAHHRDDSVETVLMHLLRGSGLRGLTGIRPRNGNIVRPLLGVSRGEIEEYLAQRGQAYVTDSTNLEADVLRNKIRLQLIPQLQALNAAAVEHIAQAAESLTQAQQVLDTVTARYRGCTRLDLAALEESGSAEYVAYEWLKTYGFNGTQVQSVLAAETGRTFTSPQGYELLVDRGQLVVQPAEQPSHPLRLPEEGHYVLADGRRMSVRRVAPYVSKSPDTATLDAARVAFPLTLRRVQQGDSMVPYGMTGRKLLSDLMTDLKMSLFEKRRQLVVADARGDIVWVVGRRTSQPHSVTPRTTEVLELAITP